MPISLQRSVNTEFLRVAERTWRGMQRKEALAQLNLGQSVAEFDQDLKDYFVETETFRTLVRGIADIVAGDKGTGKSALFRILQDRYTALPELQKVEVIPAFNASGDPIFKRLAEGAIYTEGQYRSIWKTYVLSLAGNWLLKVFEGQFTPSMEKLDALLRQLDVRGTDETPKKVFSRLVDMFKRLLTIDRAGVEFTADEAGMPVITPHVEFGEPQDVERRIIRHADSLELLNDALKEADLSVWLVLDRLDEAFTGYPATEIPALRALFRTYLDILEFDRIKLKMFVRRDLFRKITEGEGGFVNLTHINDRKVEIIWDDDDLLNLLIQRIRNNSEFMETAKLTGKDNRAIFDALFPAKVEEGAKRPETLKWILTRIKDGQGVKPPRNLIDLVKKAQEEQLRKEDREPKEYSPNQTLIEGEAIKRALTRLSEQRVQDTLLAESGSYRDLIEKFRDRKSEYNFESLADLLELRHTETVRAIRVLSDMGFLERTGDTWKVPMLYRDGLNIYQGKAFYVPPKANTAATGEVDDDNEGDE